MTGPSDSGFLTSQQPTCQPSCSRWEASSQDAQFIATPCLLQAGGQRASGPRSSLAKGALWSLRHGCLHKPTHYMAASSEQAERTSKTVSETSQILVKAGLGSDSPIVSLHLFIQNTSLAQAQRAITQDCCPESRVSAVLFGFVYLFGMCLWKPMWMQVPRCRGCRRVGLLPSHGYRLPVCTFKHLYPLSHPSYQPPETIPEAVSSGRSAGSFLRLFLKLYTPSLLTYYWPTFSFKVGWEMEYSDGQWAHLKLKAWAKEMAPSAKYLSFKHVGLNSIPESNF